jgi:integrase
MNCIKCKAIIPDGSAYCNYCGKKQSVEKKRSRKTRGNGMGCAYRRGQTWTACVTIGWKTPADPSKPKTPIRRTKGGFPSKKEAIAYCPALLVGGIAKRQEAPRLSEYWKTYSEGRMLTLGKNTQSAYRTAWKKLRAVHDIRVDSITVELLQNTIDETCHSHDTAGDCKSLLSNLFALAGAEQTANSSLPSFIVLPAYAEKEREVFTAEEQVALWKAYDNGDIRAAVPLLMIATGMMPGEMQQLKAENIDINGRVIVRSGLKTAVRKSTPIVLSDSITPVVRDLIENAQLSGYLWKRDEKAWYKNYYDILELSGCRRLTPYCCRHTCASNLSIDKNIPSQTIRKVMRWSTAKMLDRYSHPSTEDALAAVNTVTRPDV